MKPTHIDIVGRSKSTYMREIAQELGDERFASVVERLPQAPTIVLSGNVTSVGDLNGLIEFLIKRGIRRHEIQVRFPPTTRIDYLARALSQGLAKSGLDFGLDVAERDEGLVRYFITTKSFKAVQAHRKHIIVGPKGSGKSAMLRELVRNSQNALVITPEHYATEVLESLKKGATTSELAAYSTTWKYTLLVEIFKKIVQQRVGEAKALADIRSYLLNHGHLSHDISLFERFTSYLRRITKIKGRIGLVEGELGMDATEELNKLFKMDELLELLPTLQRVLRRTKFEVFLDELD